MIGLFENLKMFIPRGGGTRTEAVGVNTRVCSMDMRGYFFQVFFFFFREKNTHSCSWDMPGFFFHEKKKKNLKKKSIHVQEHAWIFFQFFSCLVFFHACLQNWCFSTQVSRKFEGTYNTLKIGNFNYRGFSRLHKHGFIFHQRFLIRCCLIFLYTLDRKFVLPLSSQPSNLRFLIPEFVSLFCSCGLIFASRLMICPTLYSQLLSSDYPFSLECLFISPATITKSTQP